MALVIADRVRETTTTTGTGTITLAGPYTGFQAFSVIGNGNTTYYAIIDASTGAWEVGIGTYTSSGNTLSRDTVLSSSTGGSAINFGAGTKDVIITQPAARAVFAQSAGSGLQAGVAAFTANGVPYAASTSTLATSSSLTWDGTTFTASNISTGGSTTLSGGTANGVAYLNGSKVLTTGSALTFDGTNLGVGVTPSAWASGWTGLQVGSSGSIGNNGTGTPVTAFSNNAYYNGTSWAYTNTAAAAQYQLSTNQHIWRYTASGSGNITWSEAMRIDGSGNLGIGTSSPAAKLDVNGTGLVSSFGSNTVAETYIQVKTGSSTLYYGGSSSYNYVYGTGAIPLTFWTNSSERMRLDSSGNLGIGVAPSAWISSGKAIDIAGFGSVAQTSSGSLASSFNAYQNSAGNWIYKTTNAASQYQVGLSGTAAHAWYTAPSGTAGNAITFTQAMTLDASGNLGVGNTSPQARFHSTAGATSQAGIFEAANSVALLSFVSNTTSSYTRVQLGAAGNDMVMYTTGAERARIDSSGNFGIGTSSIGGKLAISGNNIITTNTANSGTAQETKITLNPASEFGTSGGYATLGPSIAGYNTAGTVDSGLKFYYYNSGNQTAGATLDSSGNFGIRTTSPSTFTYAPQLVVGNGSASDCGITVYPSSSGTGRLHFAKGTTGSDQYSGYIVYRNATPTMEFGVGGSERMRIDSSGRLGLGTSSPAYPFDLQAESDYGRATANLNGTPFFIWARSRGTKASPTAVQSGDQWGHIFTAYDGTSYVGGARIFAAVDGTPGTNDMPTRLEFYTSADGSVSPVERMRIDSSGNLLVGMTSGANGSLNVYKNTNVVFSGTAGNSASGYYLYAGYSDSSSTAFGTLRYYVLANGDVRNSNNSYGAISDAKLKENVTDATPKLEKLNQVRVVNFNLIGDSQKQIGVIAQELEQIFPSMVEEAPDRDAEGNDLGTTTKSVKYSVFVPMLIKAMQEQQAIITELRARVSALEAK